MENLKPISLDYKSMQELLPDYVFKRLSEEDILKFEQSLPNFPDLQYEIAEVRAVFYKVERMNFDDNIEYKTRNMSVKVINRINSRKSLESVNRRILKFLVPTLTLAVADYFFIDSNLFKSDNEFKILQDKDKETIASIYDDSNYLDYTTNDYQSIDENYTELQDISKLSKSSDSTLENLFASNADNFLINSDSESDNETNNVKETGKEANNNMINVQELNNLGINEADLQNLLEETIDENTL